MAEPTLLKTQRVLDHSMRTDHHVSFSSPDDTMDRLTFVAIANEVWEDLGKPECITVTVEPGDKLNG